MPACFFYKQFLLPSSSPCSPPYHAGAATAEGAAENKEKEVT
jgi:hypothetical protein